MGEFRMPSLGADMDAGTIVEWRVKPGDHVRHGDIVALVDTDKSTIEVEVFEDGVIDQLLVEPGRRVPVGTVLARLSPAGQAAPRRPRPRRQPVHARAPAAAEPAATEPAARPPAVGTGSAFVRASPLARRTAAAAGVDLGTLTGRGPGGAVLAGDVVPPEPSEQTGERSAAGRQAAMRRAIGGLMARSKREIPHYYLATTIDLARAMGWLAEANDRRPVTERLLPAALLLKATALAARQVPSMNGFWDEAFQPAPAVHLGVAVSLRGGGLVAPAIHDADRLALDALMSALRDLVQRARAGTLRSSEMADPTITVTNLGEQGVEEVFGVIYPPQVALVGFGRITERPWAQDGLLGVRPAVRATLAADHRVSDGHEGARFLAAVDHLLQTPEDL